MNDEKFVILSKRSKAKQLGNGCRLTEVKRLEYNIMHVGLMFLAYYFVI